MNLTEQKLFETASKILGPEGLKSCEVKGSDVVLKFENGEAVWSKDEWKEFIGKTIEREERIGVPWS